MVVEDGVALEHRRRNLLPNKPLQLTGGFRRRCASDNRVHPQLNGKALCRPEVPDSTCIQNAYPSKGVGRL